MRLPFRINPNYVRDDTPCARSYVTCVDVAQEDGQILPAVVPIDSSLVVQTGDAFNTHSVLYGGANIGEVSYTFPMARMDLADAMSASAQALLNSREYLDQHQDDNTLMREPDKIDF